MANKNAGDRSRGRTRYQPLVDFLAASDETEIVLTFPMIGGILGRPLSTTAYVSSSTWTGSNHPYTQSWRALGWRARLDRRNRCVIFTRDTGVTWKMMRRAASACPRGGSAGGCGMHLGGNSTRRIPHDARHDDTLSTVTLATLSTDM